MIANNPLHSHPINYIKYMNKQAIHITVNDRFVDSLSFSPKQYDQQVVSRNWWNTGNHRDEVCTVDCLNVSTGDTWSFESPVTQ